MIHGWKMPEEAIATVLRDGLAFVRQSFGNGRIDELLERIYANVAPAQRAQIKTWLAETEPHIVFSFPMEPRQLPCWAIVVDPEEQTMDYLGEVGEAVELEGGEFVAVSSERWQATVGVIVHAANADLCRYLYQLAKFLVARARLDLADQFPYERRVRGRDLQPIGVGGEAGSVIAYRRVLSITVEGDQTDATRFDVSDVDETVLNATDDGNALPL